MIKVSLNVPKRVVDWIKSQAVERGCTQTEVIIGAIRVYRDLCRRMDQGHKILLQEKDGPLQELVFFRGISEEELSKVHES